MFSELRSCKCSSTVKYTVLFLRLVRRNCGQGLSANSPQGLEIVVYNEQTAFHKKVTLTAAIVVKPNQLLLTERKKCSGYLPSGCVDAGSLP